MDPILSAKLILKYTDTRPTTNEHVFDIKCYCLDNLPEVRVLGGKCTYSCPGNNLETCGGPNTLTVYDASNITCLLLQGSSPIMSNCSKKHDCICQTDENRLAVYVPVSVTLCVIVAVAIIVAFYLRRKRGKKKAELQTINLSPIEQIHPECELGEYTEIQQLPESAANMKAAGSEVSGHGYNTLHQQLEPAYSDSREDLYNKTEKPSIDNGQYNVSSVSTFSTKCAIKTQAMTDNVYNTFLSPDGRYGDYDSQYDVSSASALSKSSGKSNGQTDNVYNTFQTPNDTEYSETNFHIKGKETLPTDNEYGVAKRHI
ncbi:uncharacterized protein LOC128216572 isoform X2 [Mya arenaria]|uniref:uncharacterized protein LOC128216572 isoform X2 n=1 Tax=Mya arenaria TaxID=6604 RepID=UPI0022E1C1DF|nr:uncharacterized protein LOC128216572 isoform X2 [Mya arenaria]